MPFLRALRAVCVTSAAVACIGAGGAPAWSQAQAPDAEYRALVRELIQVTGALEMGQQIADGAMQSILASMQASGRSFPPEAVSILRETSREYFGVLFEDEDEIVQMMAEVYSQHFDEGELEELLAFYRTPVGAKAVRTAPQVAMQAMAWGQSKVMSVMDEYQADLEKRLAEAGF